jgi:cytoskeletal protein CcmA (bactofilin family)
MVLNRRLVLLGPVLVASMFGCVRSNPENKVTRIGEDVLASGSLPMVTDSVPGDAILAGGNVSFSGATGGDYLGAGGNQAISGRIHGSLRAAGGAIRVAATVDRNATITGGKVDLDSSAVVGRSAYLFAGAIQVDGAVRGTLLAAGGTVTLNGVIGANVEVAADQLRIGPHAQITGSLRYKVPAGKVHIDSGARIAGTVTALPVSRGWGFRHWLWLVGLLVAGAVVVALFPGFMTEAAEIIPRRPAVSAVVGLCWFFLVPFAMIIAAVTWVGLPLALLAAAVYAVLVSLGGVPFSVWLGKRILGARAGMRRQGAVVSFLLGCLILIVVGIVPLVGGFLTAIAGVLGLGALLLRAWALRQPQTA